MLTDRRDMDRVYWHFECFFFLLKGLKEVKIELKGPADLPEASGEKKGTTKRSLPERIRSEVNEVTHGCNLWLGTVGNALCFKAVAHGSELAVPD